MRTANFNFFGAGKVKSFIHPETLAIGDTRSADAARNIVVTGFAFGINDGTPFLTSSSSVLSLTSSVHPLAGEAVTPFPGESSSPIFSMSAEETIISPPTGAVLMAVETPPLEAPRAAVIAEQPNSVTVLAMCGNLANSSAIAVLPAELMGDVVALF